MQTDDNPDMIQAFPKVTKTTNNKLQLSARSLELIYTVSDWPPGAPELAESLKNSGKSRADLWQFAANVALEQVKTRLKLSSSVKTATRGFKRLPFKRLALQKDCSSKGMDFKSAKGSPKRLPQKAPPKGSPKSLPQKATQRGYPKGLPKKATP